MNELFKLPGRLPTPLGKIPMYKATRFASLSSRDEKYARDLARRLRTAQSSFGLKGEPVTEGARFVVRSEQASLELYAASDSCGGPITASRIRNVLPSACLTPTARADWRARHSRSMDSMRQPRAWRA